MLRLAQWVPSQLKSLCPRYSPGGLSVWVSMEGLLSRLTYIKLCPAHPSALLGPPLGFCGSSGQCLCGWGCRATHALWWPGVTSDPKSSPEEVAMFTGNRRPDPGGGGWRRVGLLTPENVSGCCWDNPLPAQGAGSLLLRNPTHFLAALALLTPAGLSFDLSSFLSLAHPEHHFPLP